MDADPQGDLSNYLGCEELFEGSGSLLEMIRCAIEGDPYLSVIIPIHSYFVENSSGSKKADYTERVLSCLREEPLTLTELARKMGYKGITAKLKKTVIELQNSNTISQVVDNNTIKLTV